MNILKKVCIISSYSYIKKCINYGSLFQYYALQKVISDKEMYPFWLRYEWFELDCRQKISRLLFTIKQPSHAYELRKILISFEKFTEKYLNVSKIYKTEEQLVYSLPDADIFITGSDQVWGGYVRPNFLSFVPDNKPKIAYAASFGTEKISDELFVKIAPLILRFQKVSVREHSGIEICKKIGVNAFEVLDPTLLLAASEYPYEGMYNKEKKVFFYFVNNVNKISIKWNEWESWAQKVGLKIEVSANMNTCKNFFEKYICYLTPEQWIGNYKYSQYIVTNSFHGTVFAILFKKNFITIFQEDAFSSQNVRMKNLLGLLGLENRIFDKRKKIEEQIMAPIEWVSVYRKLDEYKVMSEQFLSDSL